MKVLRSLIFCLIILIGVKSFAVAAPLSQQPEGPVLFVKPIAQGDADCSRWTDACDLQTALEKANPDAINPVINIWVASGTYKPTDTNDRYLSFHLKSGVGIYGGFPATGTGWGWTTRNWETNSTILSGDIGISNDSSDNSYHVVTADGVGTTAILDGFTITAGNADNNDGINLTYYGGGIFNKSSSPTLRNLKITLNSADYAAGMANFNPSQDTANGSNPTLTNVIFSYNSANVYGGGMHNFYSSPRLDGVTFSGNSANGESGQGGGMYNYDSDPVLKNVTFSENVAVYSGGGMFNENNSSPMLTNVVFSRNQATDYHSHGGAMTNDYSSPTLISVSFQNNSAGEGGGGMYSGFTSLTLTNVTFSGNSVTSTLQGNGGGMFNYLSSLELTNVTFSGNSAIVFGGGMYNTSSTPTLTNVTFTNNSTSGVDSKGGAIYNFDSGLILTNAIVWGNSPDQIKNFGSSVVAATFSDIQGGGFTGSGNINEDPHLGSLANYGGFIKTHALPFGSYAIDTGSSVVCQTTDARGFPRPIDGDDDGSEICDMGAYEFDFPRLYLPLISK